VIIVAGAQQGIELTARLLLEPGDPVWMEEPGYFGSWKAVER
jgi:GntR family transcriptional regulator/MocR family aminotransferase